MNKADDPQPKSDKTNGLPGDFNVATDPLITRRDGALAQGDGLSSERDKLAAGRDGHRTQAADLKVTHESTSNDLMLALQQQRRTSTLLNAQVQDLKERCDDLEFELAEARAEVAASRDRRKEMARVIASRDAQLKARYEELALLQKLMVRMNPWLQIKRSYGWLKRWSSR